MRPLLAAATLVVGLAFAVPAHANPPSFGGQCDGVVDFGCRPPCTDELDCGLVPPCLVWTVATGCVI